MKCTIQPPNILYLHNPYLLGKCWYHSGTEGTTWCVLLARAAVISTTERRHGKHVNVCHDRTFRQRVLRSYHRVATKVSIVTETDKAE
jgi:hypothetical protein